MLLEKMRDSAGQKEIGKWTAITSLEYGMPVTLIGESVFARCLSTGECPASRGRGRRWAALLHSALHCTALQASTILRGPAQTRHSGDKAAFVEALRQVRCTGLGD